MAKIDKQKLAEANTCDTEKRELTREELLEENNRLRGENTILKQNFKNVKEQLNQLHKIYNDAQRYWKTVLTNIGNQQQALAYSCKLYGGDSDAN